MSSFQLGQKVWFFLHIYEIFEFDLRRENEELYKYLQMESMYNRFLPEDLSTYLSEFIVNRPNIFQKKETIISSGTVVNIIYVKKEPRMIEVSYDDFIPFYSYDISNLRHYFRLIEGAEKFSSRTSSIIDIGFVYPDEEHAKEELIELESGQQSRRFIEIQNNECNSEVEVESGPSRLDFIEF